ncbi:methyltransferase [soil metagenome]
MSSGHGLAEAAGDPEAYPTFLAPPGEVADWRMLLAFDAACDAGVLAALPATPADLAADLGLDAHAVGVLLEHLAVWDIVQLSPDGGFALSTGAPPAGTEPSLRHHASAIRQWAAGLHDRLRGTTPEQRFELALPKDVWLEALSRRARQAAPIVVEQCLACCPDARRVLDLGGGRGEYALEFARRGLDTTMQDLPAIIEIAERQGRLGAAGVDLHAGDFHGMLADGPFDLVFCAGVTQMFDAAHNLDLYRRLRGVLTPSGAVAVYTFMRGQDPLLPIFAMQMMVVTDGGDTHSVEDYRRWFATAGYGGLEVADLPGGPRSVLIARTTAT